MHPFLARLANPRPILIDGATGTELARRGLDTGTPIWSALALLEAPQMVEAIHRDYLEAGAEVIITNTFRTQQRSVDKLGMGDEAARLTALAVAIAQKAVRASGLPAVENAARSPGQVFIAGSMAPLEDSYSPDRTHSRTTYLAEHGQMARDLAYAGVDLLIVETMNTVAESAAAAQAASAAGLPFGVSWVTADDGRLLSGETLADAVKAVGSFGPSFLGINCTPAPVVSVALDALQAATELPLSVYANIGQTDEIEAWRNTEDLDPAQYAACAAGWLARGAKLIGGCCNTTPEHIAAIHLHA